MSEYRLINNKKGFDAIIVINCPLKQFKKLVDDFLHNNDSDIINHSPSEFLVWINYNTKYSAKMFCPIILDF
jgi:hypothetical protein